MQARHFKLFFTVFVCGIIFVTNFYLNSEYDISSRLSRWIDLGDSPIINDRYIRHCVSDELLARWPDTTLKDFTINYQGVFELSANRIKSFQKVFKDRAWGKFSNEQEALSASGPGSTLHFSQEIMGVLHKVINDLKKKKRNNTMVKLLDVPCSDFAWMSRFLSNRDDVEYTGMDIVPELIDHHKKKYPNKNWKFINKDIAATQIIDNYDVIICRMMLQHLLIPDALKVLSVFSNNSDGLLITTTHSGINSNSELGSVAAGRVRALNLEIPPFSLTPPLCMSRDGPPGYLREIIGIWKLPLKKISNCTFAKSNRVVKFNANFFSCVRWI